jgi:signal transduction histidine kinase
MARSKAVIVALATVVGLTLAVSDVSKAVPWLPVILVAACGVLVLALLQRARRDSQRLAAASAKLELRDAEIERAVPEVNHELVDVRVLVGEVRNNLRPQADEKALTITHTIDERLGMLSIDPATFRQVLLHYLSNAIKFTPAGGRVWIRIWRYGESLGLEVQDTGIGIAPDDLGKLFTEFERLPRPAGVATPGTGLGLALTKRLVEAHGGTVDVRSDCGHGSVFTATIPCSPAAIASLAAEPAQAFGAGRSSSRSCSTA